MDDKKLDAGSRRLNIDPPASAGQAGQPARPVHANSSFRQYRTAGFLKSGSSPVPGLLFLPLLFLLALNALPAQTDTLWNRASLAQVTLNVRDADEVAGWYRRHLGFHTDSLATFEERIGLYNGDFWLVLHEPADYLPKDSVPKGPFVQFFEGYFKFGFLVKGFDKLVAQLRAGGVQFRGDVVHDPNLRRRTLILIDPEGNPVQLFDIREHRYDDAFSLQPYFLSIITNDLENSLDWYGEYLGMKSIHNLDMPDRNIFVRLLQGHDLLLELIAVPDRTLRRKNIAAPAALQGITRIGLQAHPDDRDELFGYLEGFGQLNPYQPNEEGWYPSEDGTGNVIWFR